MGMEKAVTEESDTEMKEALTLDEVLERVSSSQPLRKIRSYLNQTNLSADLKALLYDIAKISVKVGEVILAVGRRVFHIAMILTKKFPNTTLGVIVAVLLTTVVSTVLAWAPILALTINKLLILLGLTAGAVEDIRQNAMAEAMARVELEFKAYKTLLEK